MKAEQQPPTTIDEYIAAAPSDVQEILQQMRLTVREAVPDAEETISYQIPTFTLKGKYLVHFAAAKKHIGFYPTATGIMEFDDELSAYKAGKGTLRFPLDEPVPFDLITKIVKFRATEIVEKAEAKRKK